MENIKKDLFFLIDEYMYVQNKNKNGDITPLQYLQLSNLLNELSNLLLEIKNQN